MKQNTQPKSRTFKAVPSKSEPNSWNVIEVGRLNQWGEQWVEIPLVTEREARRMSISLNLLACGAQTVASS